MPITYQIDVPNALIVTQCIGNVTLADVLAHFRELPQAWPPVERLDVLLDLREITSRPTLAELETVANEIDLQIGAHQFGRCAIVANQDSMRESMSEFDVLAHRFFDGGLEVFHTPEGARMWLELTPNSRTLTRQ